MAPALGSQRPAAVSLAKASSTDRIRSANRTLRVATAAATRIHLVGGGPKAALSTTFAPASQKERKSQKPQKEEFSKRKKKFSLSNGAGCQSGSFCCCCRYYESTPQVDCSRQANEKRHESDRKRPQEEAEQLVERVGLHRDATKHPDGGEAPHEQRVRSTRAEVLVNKQKLFSGQNRCCSLASIKTVTTMTTTTNQSQIANKQDRFKMRSEHCLSASCSDSERLRDDEAEISSVTDTSDEGGASRGVRRTSGPCWRVSGSSASWASSIVSLNGDHQRMIGRASSELPLATAASASGGAERRRSMEPARARRRPAPLPPKEAVLCREAEQDAPNQLLNEQEVHCIEHFLKSHRSSVYVCGCMANLYFTRTHLTEDGRSARASSSEWRLNKTGVPVLIFDSGLTRNRNKRRLSISLAERGSGFVLWSDTIDHLSGYQAFSARLHSLDDASGVGGGERTSGGASGQSNSSTCDSFHVMYLSSNHRIMVGLSFDDATCARLFLAQIELVCADPANISLTGPKTKVGAARATKPNERAASDNMLPPPVPIVANLMASLKRRRTPVQNNGHLSSWSTLKRAAAQRLGGGATQRGEALLQQQQQQQQQQHQQHRQLSSRERSILSAFKPRPLVQLATESGAASNSVWWHRQKRPGARLLKRTPPRKCDISAPCLFQHVTSVDLDNLDRLYSRSYVVSSSSLGERVPEASETAASQTETGLEQPNKHNQQQHQQHQQQVVACKTSANLSSSSSCYSSASSTSSAETAPRSPSSTSAGSAQSRLAAVRPGHAQLVPRRAAHHLATSACPRPPVAPPKPPQRSPTTIKTGGCGETSPSANRIGSIIRELEAQVPNELVDVKRQLMADIASRRVLRKRGGDGDGNGRNNLARMNSNELLQGGAQADDGARLSRSRQQLSHL